MRQAGVDPVLVAQLAKDEMYPLVLASSQGLFAE